MRGTAAIDIVDGVPPEYFAASRKAIGPDQWDAFEAQVRAMYKQMARIEITPLWAKLLDFPDFKVGMVPNVGIVVGAKGALVIDPGMGWRNGEVVLREVQKLSPSGDLYIVNTVYREAQ